MGIGLLFALLATPCGLAVNHSLRAHWSLAPFSGLAAMAVVTSWCARLGAPPLVSTAVVVALAIAGIAVVARGATRGADVPKRADRMTVAVLCAAVAVPWFLLGTALAGVEAPVSTHDGAFHVELIDNLRGGIAVQGWYPMGFHSSVAAVLRLVPWLDTARGTTEAGQGLVMLAPLGVFALGLSLGLRARVASIGALVLALTYIYPYDDQLWGGWPLATSILLLMGLWSVAARWIADPRPGMAVLAGLLAGAIVLTHGTEVYSSVIGLAVLAALRWRRIQMRQLVRHLPLAVLGAVICAMPYLSTLVGWAAGGGASGAGTESLNDPSVQRQGGDWLEFVLGLTGAASLIDLPLRAGLLVVAARQQRMRTALAAWLVFGALLFAASFLDVEPVRRLYVMTFPWLVQHRPPQMVVLFTSLLVGAGMCTCVGWFWSLRPRLSHHAGAWRRLALVSGALLFFFAEGSAVSIFKTLQQVISEQNVYLADDRAAMSWLRQNASPGDMLINNAASDAGIWAPYKAGLPVLLPRSAPGTQTDARAPIAADVVSLEASPSLAAAACALHADFVYAGSRTVEGDPEELPDRNAMERAVGLQEVFSSGDAAVFRVSLPCAS